MAAEVSGHGVTLTVEPGAVEHVIRGPRYVGRFPACSPDCDRTPCERIGRHGLPACKQANDRLHERTHCHSGGHVEQVRAVAERVLRTYGPSGRRPRKAAPPPSFGDRQLATLDGEERVWTAPRTREGGHVYAAPDHWLILCDSPHCVADSGAPVPVAVVRPERHGSPIAEREAQRLAEAARVEHVAWHHAQFGVPGRVLLDRWIAAHSDARWPDVA